MVLSLNVRFLLAALLICCPLSCLAETVLLDFSSPTCGPCQQMRPTVQRLVADGLPVREVDITRQPQLAAQLGVTQVPTFIVMVDGQPVKQHIGSTSYEQLRTMLRPYLPTPAPRTRATPLGQSPEAGSTFANPPSNVPSNPFGNAPTRPATQPAGSPNSLHPRLLAATVKISVNDPQGKSVGTGTIVDSRSGEALVLTCGHIFRSSQGQGEITVTTFQSGPSGAVPGASYAGKLIDYDLDRDLALLSIWPTSPVQAAPIAGMNIPALAPNVTVTSVGCNHGQNPTAIDSRVTSIDRYEGTPNVEVAGAPVEGRSGGGLFNAQGQLVGVCYAADPQGNEGLYAGLPSIYAKLDSLQLSMIYQPGAVTPAMAEAPRAVAPQQVKPPAMAAQPVTSVRGQNPELPSAVASMPPVAQAPQSTTTASLPAAERAALEEIQRRGLNSEVICIIRPQDPTAKSEVITLNNVSPAFVDALANPGSPGPAPVASAGGPMLR